jgi:hypothetical protein
MRDYHVSQRRACVLIGVDPKTVRRERPPDHCEIREEMREIAAMRRRFGYRRVGVMLERKGIIMNHKKLYRIYREEGLSVRRRRGRKRARGSRTPMPEPLRPHDRWSMDFVADTFGASRRLRILAINDDCCRENLCLLGDTSISGGQGRARTRHAGAALRQAGVHRQRQRHRVHQPGDLEMGEREQGRMALHRSGQAPAERLHRIVQRQLAR